MDCGFEHDPFIAIKQIESFRWQSSREENVVWRDLEHDYKPIDSTMCARLKLMEDWHIQNEKKQQQKKKKTTKELFHCSRFAHWLC